MDFVCRAHHYISIVDKDWGKFYSGFPQSTRIFPGICRDCLLGKFGLYESYVPPTTIPANCDFPNPKEGPFLKAYRPIHKLNPDPYLVFSKGDVIIPTGQLLVDVLTADGNLASSKDRHLAQKFKLLHDGNNCELTLNPSLYNYFCILKDFHSDYFDARPHPSLEQIKARCFFEYMRILSFTNNLFVLGNLLTPDSAESVYANGSQLEYSAANPLSFELKGVAPPAPATEKITDTKSHSVRLDSTNSRKDLHALITDQIREINSLFEPSMPDVRQAMVNLKQLYLHNHFSNSAGRSAADLYVSSFCYPSSLGPNNSTKYFAPNCMFMEGIGLVAQADICNKDLLVVRQNVTESELAQLKMWKFTNRIKFPDFGQ